MQSIICLWYLYAAGVEVEPVKLASVCTSLPEFLPVPIKSLLHVMIVV